MPFHTDSDFATMFDADTGLGTSGTFTTLSGSPDPYTISAILDEDAARLENEDSQQIFKAVTLTFLTIQLTNDPVRGDTWSDGSTTFKIQELVANDGVVQTWEVTK